MKTLRRGCSWFSSWIRLSINLLDVEVYQNKISTRLTFCITAISIAGCGELDRQCESHVIFATDRCGHTWRYVFNFVVISWEAALSSWDYCSRLTLHHIVTRNGGEYNYRHQRSATISDRLVCHQLKLSSDGWNCVTERFSFLCVVCFCFPYS